MRGKRSLIGFVFLTVSLGLAYALWEYSDSLREQRVTTAEARLPAREQIEGDLQLRVELDERSKTVQAGGEPWVRALLVNTSKTTTHRVVKPGHGSEIPSREPHLHWTATIDRDGKQIPVPRRRVGYCGTCLLFSSMWQKDWILLAPGEQLDLQGAPLSEFQQAGRVRLQAHYDFQGNRGNLTHLAEELGLFAHVPPFKLSSAPVEFDVVRPLDVRVMVKGPLKANRKTHLSELLTVTLVNQSKEPIECSPPTLHADARLHLELDAEFGWRPSITEEREVYPEKRLLQPGENIPLFGAHKFANGLDGTWEYPQKEIVRIRAGYTPRTWSHAPTVLSEWVEVRVED